MKVWLAFIFLISFSFHSNCFEIIEDLSLKEDGSGTYKLTINLSDSKVKFKTLLTMDSLAGTKVPSEEEITFQVNQFKEYLTKSESVTNFIIHLDFEELIFKFNLEFKSIDKLQKHIISYSQPNSTTSLFLSPLYTFTSNTLTRKISTTNYPKDWVSKIAEDDVNLLKESSIVFISRFTKPIISTDPSLIKISKSGTACMQKISIWDVINRPEISNFKIFF